MSLRLPLPFAVLLALATAPLLADQGDPAESAGAGPELPFTPPGGTANPAAARPEPLAADPERLRRTMAEARVATGRPRPGLSLWARDAGAAFSHWMADWMQRTLPRYARRLAPFFEPAVMVLLALLSALLLAFLASVALDRWRRRRQAETEPAVRSLAATGEPQAARDWEAEIRRRLADADVAAAIEALWWWLASRLVGERAEPSWTSRELIQRAGRRDLRTAVRRLDRMIYGGGRPETGDVRRLWRDLREAVG